ncbi:hypothetical protein WMY93_002491 [Mugilogobius chulae]|uniref:G-protein coupled receptors family 1 profile domain-containing protein n=1 Tax=Mugilogobius chulae TaxID=88201 RepID=A0AAW0PVQ4_9GOBI
MASNLSSSLPLNSSSVLNTTTKPFSVFEGCEHQVEGILFDLTLQVFNVIIGIPANILVIYVLIKNRKDPSTSDIFLGCLAFMDAYFGIVPPISFLNFYHWHSKEVWSSIKFAYGVKDTSGPLFLSCICLDRFMAPVGFAFLNISSTIQPLVYLSRLEKVPFLPDNWVKRFCPCCERKANDAASNSTQGNPA